VRLVRRFNIAVKHAKTTNRHAPVLTRTERRGFAFLTFTHIADDLYSGAVPALLPFLALERHYSCAGLTGIMLGATFLASVVQPGFGALTDKHRNLGWLLAAGLLVAGLGIGLAGLGDSYLITWAAVAASGVGVAAYHPEATRVARGLAGDSTQAMSWFTIRAVPGASHARSGLPAESDRRGQRCHTGPGRLGRRPGYPAVRAPCG
jgi:MFS transporter, FSR family, fosmidomycin resistance protein